MELLLPRYCCRVLVTLELLPLVPIWNGPSTSQVQEKFSVGSVMMNLGKDIPKPALGSHSAEPYLLLPVDGRRFRCFGIISYKYIEIIP